MHHIDEHTIELYILGSELVKEQTAEIEAHLKECYGCRTVAEQMEAFYKEAEGFLPQSLNYVEGNLQQSKSLMRLPTDLTEYDIPLGSRVPYKPTTVMAKFWYFVYRHPIPSAVTSFATVAAMVLGINYSITDLMKDKNPAYPHLNPNNATIEIYNKNNQLLWEIPAQSIYKIDLLGYEDQRERIQVVDIDGDKKNEIVTTIQIGKHSNGLSPLTFFSSTGKRIKELSFSEHLQFHNINYSNDLNALDILFEDFDGSGKKEIIVNASNSRSPNIIYRIINNGDVGGGYFHFGSGKIKNIKIGKKKFVAFLGRNDVGEPESLSFPVLIILDPLKIAGKAEASDSRGFGLPVSKAELFVIRFPLTDMNYLWNTAGFIGSLNESIMDTVGTTNVWVLGNRGNDYDPKFEYIFSSDMKIIDIKLSNGTINLRNKLITQEKVKGIMDRAYLDNLKNGIRYWNGKEWQKEWTMVKH
ncbi:MAG: hypothetical protein HY964_01495 [Ignavibacteriales bacterium]|nr:hypothetical protein [Ignavibacteriales bacterium]